MASKFFRKAFEFVGKRGPTIKGVQPTKSKAVQDKIKLIKKAGKLQKKQGMDTYKKIGVDKVTKDIYKMDVPKSLRQKKAEGGVLKKLKENDPDKKLRKEGKLPLLKMFGGGAGKPANKQIKGDSGKQKKKAPFDKKDKPATLREKIAPKRKMDRLKELKKELN